MTRKSQGRVPMISRLPRKGWQALQLLLLLMAILFPLIMRGAYVQRIAVLSLIYFMLAVGYSILITNAGIFEFGYTAYFALGAYTGALLTLHTDLSFWFVLPISVLVTVALTMLLTIPILRFRGDYLCIVTLAFAEILRLVLVNWGTVTRGPKGLPDITAPSLFSYTFEGPMPYYYLALGMVILCAYLGNRLIHSGIGLSWTAIREYEDAALSMGVNTNWYKRLAYAYASAVAAAAGVLFAHFQTIVTPAVAALDNTVLILAMAILGGGSISGLFLASALLTGLPELLRQLALHRMLVLGLSFIVLMNVRPDGFTSGIVRHFVLPETWQKKRNGAKSADRPMSLLPGVGYAKSAELPTTDQRERKGRVIFETRQLSKAFGGLTALDSVDLQVREGEILSIIGPNGAGKTTLFNICTGTYRPTSGHVFLSGQETTRLPAQRLAVIGIGRTFQTIKVFGNMTVLDNVMVARVCKGVGTLGKALVSTKSTRKMLEENVVAALQALDYIGLHARADELAKNLPYGDQRRLEIARALALEPRLLFLDEPTAGMNPREVEDVMVLLRRINGSGITLVLIEHNMQVAMGISDRIVVLNHGIKVAEGTPLEVQQQEVVIEAYLGRRRKYAASIGQS